MTEPENVRPTIPGGRFFDSRMPYKFNGSHKIHSVSIPAYRDDNSGYIQQNHAAIVSMISLILFKRKF